MTYTVLHGDVLDQLATLPDESVQCVVTSPPYWGLRDYKADGQIGLEKTPQEYVAKMVAVFAEVRRVLRKDGTVWLNLGDSYAGSGKGGNPPDSPHQKQATNAGSVIGETARIAARTMFAGMDRLCGLKPKDLIGIPWRVAFALQEDGWYLRSDIIWAKKNCMPESVKDRPTRSHEYIFLLTKSPKYYYDANAIKEQSVTNDTRRPYGSEGAWELDGRAKEKRPNGKQRSQRDNFKRVGNKRSVVLTPAGVGTHRPDRKNSGYSLLDRNKRDVWHVATQPFAEAHFATFPPKLIEPCILAGSKPGDTVLDPFVGSGTTLMVAIQHGRIGLGIELNADYIEMARRRIETALPLLAAGND